jgi:O-antigen/teichoic acid export membrane protein
MLQAMRLRRPRPIEVGIIGAQVLGAVAAVLGARAVGPAGRGDLVVIAVWGQIIGWVCSLSIDKEIVARSGGRSATANVSAAVRVAAWSVMPFAFVGGIVTGIAVSLVLHGIQLAVIGAVVAFATPFWEIASHSLIAEHRDFSYALLRCTQTGFYVVAAAIALGVAGSRPNRDLVAMIGEGLALSLLIPTGLVLRGHLRKPYKLLEPPMRLRQVSKIHVGQILQALNSQLDLLILPLVLSLSDVGIYSIGVSVGMIGSFLASAAFMRALRSPESPRDSRGIRGVLIIGIMVIATAPVAIPVAFGPAFDKAVPLAQLFAVASVFNYLTQAGAGRLVGRRQPWRAAAAQGAGAILFLALLLLYPTLIGAATASLLSFVCSWILAEWGLHSTRSRRLPGN